MKNGKKKKVIRKSEKSKKKERSSKPSGEKGDKWQEFLRRHSKAQEQK